MDDREILTVDQVADVVQLSSKTVLRAIAAGHLEASQTWARSRGLACEEGRGRSVDGAAKQCIGLCSGAHGQRVADAGFAAEMWRGAQGG